MSAVGEDVFIEAVNDSDVPVGLVRRRDVFTVRANFRVAHVLVFNSRNELLIQRLATSRNRNPGFWGSSVAAYLYANETYEMAAARRIGEELGILPTALQFVGKTSMDDTGVQKFIGVFTTYQNGPFRPDPTHIDRIEFAPIPAILVMRETGEREFTPTFLRVLDFYLHR